MSKFNLQAFAAALLVAAFFVVLYHFTDGFQWSQMQAKNACMEYGAEFITYPDDAEWHVEQARSVDYDAWLLQGYVLSPNAFGQRGRTPFLCQHSPTSGVEQFELAGVALDLLSRLERISNR